jgi:hypothetical protein
MHRLADGNVLDAHVVLADVVALRMARAAAGPAHAPGGSSTVSSITSLQDRRRRWAGVPPDFPGDAA